MPVGVSSFLEGLQFRVAGGECEPSQRVPVRVFGARFAVEYPATVETEIWVESAVAVVLAVGTGVGGFIAGRSWEDSREDRARERERCKNDSEVLKEIRLFVLDWEGQLAKIVDEATYSHMDVSDSKMYQFFKSRTKLKNHYMEGQLGVEKYLPTLLFKESKSVVKVVCSILSSWELLAKREQDKVDSEVMSYVNVFTGIEDGHGILSAVKNSKPTDCSSDKTWRSSKAALAEVESSMNRRSHKKNSEYGK